MSGKDNSISSLVFDIDYCLETLDNLLVIVKNGELSLSNEQ